MNAYDDVDARPRKKGGIPTWLWLGCGGGCLGLIAIFAVLGFLGKGLVEDMTNTEEQWPELQKVLPYDEQPTDVELVMGMKIPFTGMRQFVLMDRNEGLQATVFVMTRDVEESIGELMKEKPRGTAFGLGHLKGAEEKEFEIQGELVPAMTFTGIKGQDVGPEEHRPGTGARLNLHAVGLEGVLVELRKLGSTEPLTELEVETFFARFRLF